MKQTMNYAGDMSEEKKERARCYANDFKRAIPEEVKNDGPPCEKQTPFAFLDFVNVVLKEGMSKESKVTAAHSNLEVLLTAAEILRKESDHSYCLPRIVINSEPSRKHVESDSEETVESNEPVKVVKRQFILGSNSFSNPLISSFDVAQIEEFKADGTPVNKYKTSSCLVHSPNEKGCTIKPRLSNGQKSVNLRSINANNVPKSQESKDEVSSKYSENGENVSKSQILKLIDDLSKKKKNKSLICKICNRRFSAVASLKNHYRSHGNIKLYKCPLCNSSFTRRFGLKYHLLIHSKKYRHTCPVCSKNFRHTSHFKKHCKDHHSRV